MYTNATKYLQDEEEKIALGYLENAATIARAATCTQAQCGTVIVKDGRVIGAGFNSPPLDLEGQRRCGADKNTYNEKVTDKTCCIHAEQRAIMDALATHPNELAGSRLYFMRIDSNDDMTRAGNPWCTICSKIALDAGIAEFVLWHDDGVCVYDTEEYNTLSFAYQHE